jgi:hypothetical protein
MHIYNTPYTYLIGWSELDIWYYGSQYGRKANPSNLWVTYFTSSKHVKKFREKYGEPDVKEIRKTFPNDSEAAREWEYKVLHRLKAKQKEKFLNKTNSKGISNEEMLLLGKHPSQNIESRKKIGLSNKGRLAGDKNPSKREDVRKKLRKPKSEEHKKKISEGAKRRIKIGCEYCHNLFDPGNFSQFHGEKCKFKPLVCEEL